MNVTTITTHEPGSPREFSNRDGAPAGNRLGGRLGDEGENRDGFGSPRITRSGRVYTPVTPIKKRRTSERLVFHDEQSDPRDRSFDFRSCVEISRDGTRSKRDRYTALAGLYILRGEALLEAVATTDPEEPFGDSPGDNTAKLQLLHEIGAIRGVWGPAYDAGTVHYDFSESRDTVSEIVDLT